MKSNKGIKEKTSQKRQPSYPLQPESNSILGVRVDFLSSSEVLNRIERYLEEEPFKETALVSTTNPEFIMTAQKDSEFRKIINTSFLSVPDGVGVLYANYYLNGLLKGNFKKPLGGRVPGVQLVYDLCALAERENYSVFLLGGWPTDYLGRPIKDPGYDLASKAGEELKQMYPDLNLVGATSKFSYRQEDDEETVTYIQEAMEDSGVGSVDILIVCYGHAKQEKWIQRNANKIPARLAVGAGGTFDYISKEKSWAPKWIQAVHLEWLYRLVTQPWRIRRIVTSFLIFPLEVLLTSKYDTLSR
ncbi:WecB/TagA/CpsF family glycosyltransferase [candidate division WWE3 bacterium]|nr:WecB/TagA/CpsF family glycosyltransferase [candidate division WWE3 bacterium]